VSSALANFLFEAGNFLLLAAGLGWILFRPIRRALDAERDRHNKEEEDQQRRHTEAEALAQQTRDAHQATVREAAARRDEALAAARQEAARLVDEARKAQTAEREVFQREQQSRREAEVLTLADTLGHIAGESVTRLLQTLDGPSLDDALIRAVCDELRAQPTAARGPVVLESARPLDDQAKALLQAVLPGGFEQRTVAELGAGVRITTAGGQFDGTAVSVARTAARAVTAAGGAPDA